MLTQCLLKSDNWFTVTWISSSIEIGQIIILKDNIKKWTVIEKYGSVLQKDIINTSHNSKKIWKATSGNSPIGHK